MRNTLWLFPVLLGVAMTPLSCGDDEGTATTGTPTGKACERSEECEDSDPCTFDNCIVQEGGKFCQNDALPNGDQPPAAQTDGDCNVLRCEDGVEVEVEDDDPPDDANDQDCMVPSCSAGASEMIPEMVGEGCPVSNDAFGACNDVGVCSCAPASSDVRVYVDAQEGADTDQNGAGPGACAYATLEYALARANGEIVLRDATYDSTNVTTWPITLSGRQVITCRLDYDTDPPTRLTTITGSGTFGAGTASIVYGGTRNGVVDCIVDAAGADVAVAVNTAAAELFNENNHAVWYSEVTGAVTGIEMTAAANNLYVARSQIHTNTTNGILFSGTDQAAYLEDNTFSGNGVVDITCADLNGNVDGDSNGGPTCSVCENCGGF